jgi:magnesium transporter
MVPAIVCHPNETVEHVVGRMRSTAIGHAATVFVLDANRRLTGQVPVTSLLLARPRTEIRELMTEAEASVAPDVDQEQAASIAIAKRAAALPVVDEHGRLLGILPAEALMDVLRAEHLEDLHRLSGVARDQQMAREAIEAPPMRRARHRLPWLLIGLAGSAAATMVMAGFESTLQSSVAVAFFVPGIVYLADAIGTQTEAAAVRGLSLTREPLSQLVGGELRTGLLMGVTLAAITLPTVWLGPWPRPSAYFCPGSSGAWAGTRRMGAVRWRPSSRTS